MLLYFCLNYIRLVLYQRPRETNRFSVEVNVGAKEKVVFNLTYQELLKRKRGSYEHVIFINPQQIVKDFQIYVFIQESRDITSVRVPPLRDYLVQNLAVEGIHVLVNMSIKFHLSTHVFFFLLHQSTLPCKVDN